jgi:hypothetical protein
MVWAFDRLQSDGEEVAKRYVTYPPEAVTTELTSDHFVMKWALETLVNEILANPKQDTEDKRKYRIRICDRFATVAEAFNRLNRVENAEAGMGLDKMNVFYELNRIAQRQFPWQSGYTNRASLLRSAYIFNTPVTNKYFEAQHGISVVEFIFCSFAIWGHFRKNPYLFTNMDFGAVGIDSKVRGATIKMLSIDYADARQRSERLRSRPGQIAYKPSILRDYPCIRFDDGESRLVSPLCDLVMYRATSGIYYHVIGADDAANIIGSRFEEYSLELLKRRLPNFKCDPSFRYRFRKNNNDSVDITLKRDNKIFLAVECKSKRMSYQSKFSADPLQGDSTGFNEITKGIYQTWKFFSHIRRGIIKYDDDTSTDDAAIGMVLTLDSWNWVSRPIREEVLRRAHVMASAKDPGIEAIDKKPVILCSVEDMERVLMTATEESFSSALALAVTNKYEGWQFSTVHSEAPGEKVPDQPSHFSEAEIGELLPWWKVRNVGTK